MSGDGFFGVEVFAQGCAARAGGKSSGEDTGQIILEVMMVAAQQFVSPLTIEYDLDMTRGQLHHMPLRKWAGAGTWFVVIETEPVDKTQVLFAGGSDVMSVGVERRGGGAGVMSFGKLLLVIFRGKSTQPGIEGHW